jgi:Condensation domain
MNRREDLAALGHLSADQRRLLDRLLGGQMPAAEPGKPIALTANRDHVELSSAQRRLWFFDRLRPGSPLYNMAGVASLQGTLDPGALKRALDEVVRRHEVLRTALRGDSEPWAVVSEPRPVTMEVTDLSRLPDEDRAKAAQGHIAAATLRPFDLSQDLLLRACAGRELGYRFDQGFPRRHDHRSCA